MFLQSRQFLILSILGILSLCIWFRLSYSQLAIVNFSIDRQAALKIAQLYLEKKSVKTDEWRNASVLEFEGHTNRYLQKTVGFEGLKKFIKDHNYDLFIWVIRFFKENNKEEYRVVISAATGEIIAYKHFIEEKAERKVTEKEEALAQASAFLKDTFHINLENYSLKMDTKQSLDHRTEFSFGWQHNTVDIPWNDDPEGGKGRLTSTVTIAGDEILTFAKNNFNVPDDFYRSLAAASNIAANIGTWIRLIYFSLFTFAIFYVIARRNHLAMHTTKWFYIGLAACIFVFNILADFNEFQAFIFGYETISPFHDQLWRYWVENIRGTMLMSIAIIIPALAGELLYFETLRQKREGTFLHFIHSTFLSRKVTHLIYLGYLVCFIMLGMQSALIALGQKYLGVWTEYSWANNLTTAYWPFLSAFIIGFKTGVFEELFFRMYCLSWAKKFLKNTFIGVIVMSFFWGLAHTGYPVYPMWFRGLEVGVIGLFMSFMYLQFGIIPVIVGHFLFNVFWNNAGFIFGTTKPFYFYSTLGVFFLPAMWALFAFIKNNKVAEKIMTWHLNKAQHYNLQILESYLRLHPELINHKTHEALIKEISSKGWDIAVVETAVENTFGKPGNS